MQDSTMNDTLEQGEVMTLTQPSARRRSFELRRAGVVIGSLEWGRGRRSTASATIDGIGSLSLGARRRRLVVLRDGSELAVVTWEARREARIEGPGTGLRLVGPGRGHGWTVRDGGGDVLIVRGSQGVVRAAVEIAVARTIEAGPGLVLCVVAGFAALRDLQAGVDAGAAVAAVVAST